MGEVDADTTAEMSSRTPNARRGTTGETSSARQTSTARTDSGGDTALTLIEPVVRRENLVAAHARVVRNGGAPGVDGMPVDGLMPYLHTQTGIIRHRSPSRRRGACCLCGAWR